MTNKKYKIVLALFVLIASIGSVFAVQYLQPFPTTYYDTDLSKYIPGFSPEMCTGGSDFLVQVDPTAGCSPRVIRSDLLEENSIPIFCQLQAIKINPLLDVPEIKSITLKGQTPKEIVGLTFYPARAALSSSSTELIGSPTINNIGYLVTILQKQSSEKEMPDWITANVTAHIEYDALKTYGIGYKEIVSNDMKDESEWQSSYKQYGFWNGKGYVRVYDVGEENVQVDIYTDANNKLATYIMKKGKVERGYLPGWYCAAGYDIRLDDIKLPDIKAKLVIGSDDATVSKGSKILDGKCEVSEITESSFGGGRVKLTCPDGVHYLDINLPTALMAAKNEGEKEPTSEEYTEYNIGDNVANKNDKHLYLVYLGESADKKDFAVVISKSQEKEITEVQLNAITNIIEKISNPRQSVGKIFLDTLRKITFSKNDPSALKEEDIKSFNEEYTVNGLSEALKKQNGNKNGFIQKILKDSGAQIALVLTDSPQTIAGIKIFFKGIKGLEEENNQEENKALKKYYDDAIKSYQDTANSFPNEMNSLGDYYGAIALEKAAKLASELGKKKERKELLEQLIEKYPDSPQAENAKSQIALTIGYDMSKALAEVKIKGKSYYVTLESIEPASVADLGVEIIIGDKETFSYGVGDSISNDKNDKITLSSIDKEKATFSYEYKQTGTGISSKEYTIKLGSSSTLGSTKIFVSKIRLNREAHITVSPVIRGGSMDANFTLKIAIEKRAIKLSPEKTKELINTLNTSIAQWEKTVNDLGNLVKAWKTTCFAGAIALQAKAFFSNLGGGSIARTEVMKEYREICAPQIGIDKEFKSFSACYQNYNTEITKDIERIKQRTNEVNTVMKDCREQANADSKDNSDSTSFFKTCVESKEFDNMQLTAKKSNSIVFDKDSVQDWEQKYVGDTNTKFTFEGESKPMTSEELLAELKANPEKYDGKTIKAYQEIDKSLTSKDFKDLKDQGRVFDSDLKDILKAKYTLDDCKNGLLSNEYCEQFENSEYSRISILNEELKKNADKDKSLGGNNFDSSLMRQLYDIASPSNIGANINVKNMVVADKPSSLKVLLIKTDAQGNVIKNDKGEEQTTDISKDFKQLTMLGSGGGVIIPQIEKVGKDVRVVKAYKSISDKNNELKLRELTDEEKISNGLVKKDKEGNLVEQTIMLENPTVLGTCQGKLLDTEKKVKYFDTEPYKGLPAIVPLSSDGWYVSVPPYKVIGTQSSSAYDQSGLLKNFWICNAGQNGRIEFFNSPLGDDADCCAQYTEGMPTTGWRIDGLDEIQSQAKVRQALSAIGTAATNYGQKTIRINDLTLTADVQPILPSAECEEFMSPSDCNLMFNLCDPVLCPTSRCNLGGRFAVDDVAQSGIIGSIALCLPNFGMPSEGGVLVPVCLTGIHAGLDNLVTILKASRDCLQASLDNGTEVGICDEIKSIYLCEFFWKEITPFLKAGVPAIVSSITGKNKGGGEYLTFNDAWDKSSKSLQYFTNSYGLNAFKAFRARTTTEVGSDICQAFISQRYPTSAFLDELVEPESPSQFYANFEEISLTSATIPARSQYKVYYHIYSGKDEGVNYYIYLKRTPGTSVYLQTETVYVASGFIAKGEYIDKTPDILAPSGMQELCVRINFKEECGFGKVTTSFAVNELTARYLADQATKEVTNAEECTSGTPSVSALASSLNIEQGLSASLQPTLMQQGITRICAGSNPSTNTEPARWSPVGYCDDAKKIRCWLDTESVKKAIIDKGLQNETLEAASKNLKESIDSLGLMGDDESKAKLKELEDGTQTLSDEIDKILQTTSLSDANIIDKINNVISSTVSGFKKVIEKAYTNAYKARAQYGLGSLYDVITNKINGVFKSKEATTKLPEEIKVEAVLAPEKTGLDEEITITDINGIYVKGKGITTGTEYCKDSESDKWYKIEDCPWREIDTSNFPKYYDINLDENDEGTYDLNMGNEISVLLNGDESKLKLEEISVSDAPFGGATITIEFSTASGRLSAFEATGTESKEDALDDGYTWTGMSKKIDLNGDKKYDTVLALADVSVKNQRASISLKRTITFGETVSNILFGKKESCSDCRKNLDLICGREECHNLGKCYVEIAGKVLSQCIECSTDMQCSDFDDSEECNPNNCGLDCIWSNRGCIENPSASDEKKNLNDELTNYNEEYSSNWEDYISEYIEEDFNVCPEESETGITGQASRVCTIITRKYSASDFSRAKSEDTFSSRQKIYGYIDKYAKQYNINFNIVRAIIQTETEWDEKASAASGAYGLMQLKPSSSVEDLKKGTCSKLYGPTSINVYNTEQNIKGGIMYLNCMITLFKGNLPLALAAYRMGPTAIAKNCKKDLTSCYLWWGGRPMAISYVQRIKQTYEGFLLTSSKDGKIIAIDPGHGGGDSGAIGVNGLQEKDIALSVALKLRDILASQGFRVIMTRDSDVYITPSERAKIANNADAVYFISIHADAADNCENAEGSSVYYLPELVKSKTIAQLTYENVVAALGSPGNRKTPVQGANYQVLRESKMPAILIEMGFICNKNDVLRFDETDEQLQIAAAISQSIKSYA